MFLVTMTPLKDGRRDALVARILPTESRVGSQEKKLFQGRVER